MTSGFGRPTAPGNLSGDDLAPMFIKGGRGWRPRDADGWRPGFVLAVAAHVLLALGLAFSVSWKLAQDEPAVEAELWSEIPRGAPPSVAPPPPPKVEPQPEPVAPPPPKVVERAEPEPAKKPDIVTERAPKKVEKPRKQPKETFDTTPPKPVKDDKAEKLAKEKAEKAAKAEQAEKAKAEKERQAREAKAAAEREALRKANLAKMMNELGGSGGSGVPSVSSAGPSAAYAGRIKARIKPNIVFTEQQIPGNPVAKVEVRCAPDGRIMSVKLVSSSGVVAWDAAVLRAIDRTEVLPLDEHGKVPPMLLEFRPNDF